MSVALTIYDESMTGEKTNESVLEFLTERITVQELIKTRVYQEVKDHNMQQSKLFRGLIQPTDTEQTLNGYKMKKPRHIDWEEQYKIALEAMKNRQIIILVDNKQLEKLDDEIVITPKTQVSFLKLVLLAGG